MLIRPLKTEDRYTSAANTGQSPTSQLGEGRFRTAPFTLWTDRMMTHFIKGGGIAIILTVLAIFVFIFTQTLPLFRSARVTPNQTLQLPREIQPAILGVDEWGELPYVVDDAGSLTMVSGHNGQLVYQEKFSELLDAPVAAVAKHFLPGQHTFYAGTADGRIARLSLSFKPVFRGDQREIKPELEAGELYSIHETPFPVRLIAGAGHEEHRLVAAVLTLPDEKEALKVTRLVRERSLFGAGEESIEEVYDLSSSLKGRIEKISVSSTGDEFVVLTEEGRIYYFVYENDEPHLRQTFSPFSEERDRRVASMNYLNGDVTLVLTNSQGLVRLYSLFVAEGQPNRMYYATKEFPALKAGATFFARSLRNKAFLLGSGTEFFLGYATTAAVRWKGETTAPVRDAVLSSKYDQFFLLNSANQILSYKLDDPHPEAGWKAFAEKVWYEGYPEPDFVWQSTGGTDDFEPKLSLVPLLLGTLKGTFYAMLFALPLALLAALYTSQFAHLSFKRFIKPTMEIMASLPSVVLGFLAALWLAPLIEDKIPSLLLCLIFVPCAVLLFGQGVGYLPNRLRMQLKSGSEWLIVIPVIVAAASAGWALGPWLERTFFVVQDPQTGVKIADFRLWWPTVTGLPFEQRNSLVVGFMMGFAVIPIIFTIAEDSLSNVPKSLTSASLALGASRWQTAMRVVLPTAFPGIFSAVMVGLGRAIGETMIVVMATGNTPVMDFNIFSGMRTLSANIAVELPEAPYLGTLYRTLFLGATLLFMMTFVLNTIAEVIRQRLRTKYRVL